MLVLCQSQYMKNKQILFYLHDVWVNKNMLITNIHDQTESFT